MESTILLVKFTAEGARREVEMLVVDNMLIREDCTYVHAFASNYVQEKILRQI